MPKKMRLGLVAWWGMLVIIGCGTQKQFLPSTPTAVKALPNFDHIVIIVMENKKVDQIVNSPDAPYLNDLAAHYGSATQYYGITHPSLPNYLALTGGDTFGVTTDCTDCFVNRENVVDEIKASGRSWKAYMESMPTPCFVGNAKPYVQKHNPFIYYDDVRNNPARCNNIVPLEELTTDLQQNALPNFVWITPNMCNNMHDCPIETGDAWLKNWVPEILASAAWQADSVLFITFDESKTEDASGCCTYAAGGRIATLVISPRVASGFKSDVAYSHYSLLRTIEEAWGLPFLGKAECACTTTMSDFFQTPTASP